MYVCMYVYIYIYVYIHILNYWFDTLALRNGSSKLLSFAICKNKI